MEGEGVTGRARDGVRQALTPTTLSGPPTYWSRFVAMPRLKSNAGRARRRAGRLTVGRLAAPPIEERDFDLLRFMAGGGPAPKKSSPSPSRAPGSESAGYHSDLSVPGYHPSSTPTTAPPPGAEATGPAGLYDGAEREYRRAVRAIPPPAQLLPAPPALTPVSRPQAAKIGASLAHLLTPAGVLEALVGRPSPPQLSQPEPPAPPVPHHNPDQNAATAMISSRPGRFVDPDPLGKKTPGNATVAELAAASRDGTLRVGPRGRITTAPERHALRQLEQAREAVASSGPSLQHLHDVYPHLSISTLKGYRASARATGVPPQLLAGIEGQESDYGRSTLPGVRSGQNFAGAAGPFQIGNGTGAAGDWWGENMPESADIYQDRDAAIGAGKYLTQAGATKDPASWYDAAFSYNHADWYAQKAVQLAQQHRQLARLGLPPNPKAVQALQAAKRYAREQGINPTPFNGDVAGGDQDFTIVRADAKGMVDWAESAVGTAEGSPKQLRWAGRFGIDGSQPWCANFVSNGLLRRGVTQLPSNPNYVGSYESEWGQYAVPGGLAKAKPGDLVTFSGSHMGVYVGGGEMISGNSSDAVSRTSVGSPSMVIRPPYRGGKVRVADSQITGSTATSALGGGEVGVGAPAGGAVPGIGTSRPAPQTVALTPLSSPLAAGPVLPSDLLGAAEQETHGESAAETLLAILGEGTDPAAMLPRRALL